MNPKLILLKGRLFFILVFLFFSFTSNGQENSKDKLLFSLSGIVQDNEFQKPLKYATVSIYSLPDSALVQGAITNKKGEFSITKLKNANYFYKVEFLGFTSFKSEEINLKQSLHLVKPIELQLDVKNISEVNVTGQREFERIELDRSVYNVSKSLAAESGNITDVLTTIPKLDVDADGNLKYRGSSDVKVLIDGKMSRLIGMSSAEVLNSLPANDVDRVEVISNPSAKYDASGSAGIVNIIMKKNRAKGFNGNTSLMVGTKGKFTGRTSLSLRTGKFNFSGSYSYTDNEFGRDYTSTFIVDGLELPKTQTQADVIYSTKNHFGQLGIDYLINDRNTLSVAVSKRKIKQNWDGEYRYTKSDLISSAMPTRSFREGTRERNLDGLNYNLSYVRKFERKGQELSIDAAYIDNSSPNEGFYRDFGDILSSSMSESSDEYDEGRKEGIVQLDYKQPLGDIGSLETGYMFRSNEMDFKVPVQVDANFNYKESIHSAYTQISGKKDKFGYQFGLRAEYSDVNSNKSYNDDYLDLFPSFHLSYKLSKNKQLQLSYSKLVVRPSSRVLNPFQNKLDPQRQTVGSEDIRQYYTHKPEITFVYKSKKVTYTTNLYYQIKNDYINAYREIDLDNNAIVSYENISKLNYAGLDFNMSFKLNKWWSVNSYLTGNYHKFDPTDNIRFKKKSDFGYFGKVTSTMRIPKLFTVQTITGYESKMPLSQGRFDEYFYTNLTIAKRIMKGKAVVSLRVYDLFNTQEIATKTAGDKFSHRIRYKFENRIAHITFNYYFGKKYKVLKAKKRKYGREHKEKDI